MHVRLDEIKPNTENPRSISQANLDKLVRSLKEFPEMLTVRPLVVNSDMVLIGGNMRLQALHMAGANKVMVTQVDWTQEQQREFIIKDNLGYGIWDFEVLEHEWLAEKDLFTHWGFDAGHYFLDPVQSNSNVPSTDENYSEGETPESKKIVEGNSVKEASDISICTLEFHLSKSEQEMVLSSLSEIKSKLGLTNINEALLALVSNYLEE